MSNSDETIRPVFVSRKTAAALLEISPDTFDQWVRSGFVPPAAVNRGQITRWHWPTVEAKLAERPSNVEADAFGREPPFCERPDAPPVSPKSDYPRGVFRIKKPNGAEYWYYQHDKGKPSRGPIVRLPEFGTPEFYEALRDIRGERGERRNDISALISDYKAAPQWSSKRPATIATYESALVPINEQWGDRAPDSITTGDVIDLLNKFADRPSMGNMVRVVVRKLMKFAVQRGRRQNNPTGEVDTFQKDTDGAKPLTPAAWAALNSPACPTAVHRLAVLGRATGQRISDLIRMRPADRDEEGISCTITKLHDKPHWCLLKPGEAAEIDSWGVVPAMPYVLRPDGRRYTTDAMRVAWNDYLATPEGAALAGFTPHDLRATKVCDERIAGKNHQQISALVGMSVPMVMKYSKHIDQRLAARGSV
ncbi:integrase [Ancylobacter sp. 3268]|uniref:tyrosine-type recombinase/integrase n=1 Tax=Ancylobacter sp. 3268 TaxID=2817752 RepID=UPI00285731A5|nr:hypothetical protein [Ancylobacter sp. 3268]MDR6954446.1 integrase [Ancylobacter sp. 3268]